MPGTGAEEPEQLDSTGLSVSLVCHVGSPGWQLLGSGASYLEAQAPKVCVLRARAGQETTYS